MKAWRCLTYDEKVNRFMWDGMKIDARVGTTIFGAGYVSRRIVVGA